MRFIKRLLKHSRMFRTIFLICIILLLGALVFRSSYTLKTSQIEDVKSMEQCLVSMDLPNSYSQCLEKLGLEGQEINRTLEDIDKLSEDLRLESRTAIIKKDYEKARTLLNEYLVENPEDIKARKALIFAEMNLREYYGVKEHCERILEQNPNDTFCLDAQGIAYYLLDENEKAIENAEKAFELEQSFCHELNYALFKGGVGEIEETKIIIDRLISENKTLILKCWSPVKQDIPDSNIDNYDICFLNKQRKESVCRAFAEEGWRTKKLDINIPGTEEPELPDPVFSM